MDDNIFVILRMYQKFSHQQKQIKKVIYAKQRWFRWCNQSQPVWSEAIFVIVAMIKMATNWNTFAQVQLELLLAKPELVLKASDNLRSGTWMQRCVLDLVLSLGHCRFIINE